MSSRALLACLGVTIAALTAALWPSDAAPAVPQVSVAIATTTAEPTGPVDVAVGAVAPTRPEATEDVAAPSRRLELPDGTFVDALNGAVDAPSMKDYWGPFAWSPIVGVERSGAGLDWYKHADGSYSTTQMVMRSDLGRMAAMTRVAHPGPATVPTAPKQGR